MHRALAILEWPQVCVKHCLIRGRARGAKSNNRENAVDFRVTRNHFFRLAANIARVGERSALRRLHDKHQVALIVFRDERARNALIEPVGAAQQRKEEQQRSQPPVQSPSNGALIKARAGAERVVE